MTYVYADRAVVIGPLSTYAEPHAYDLCRECAASFTPPKHWEVLRIPLDDQPDALEPDDLMALAYAIREVAEPPTPAPVEPAPPRLGVVRDDGTVGSWHGHRG